MFKKCFFVIEHRKLGFSIVCEALHQAEEIIYCLCCKIYDCDDFKVTYIDVEDPDRCEFYDALNLYNNFVEYSYSKNY